MQVSDGDSLVTTARYSQVSRRKFPNEPFDVPRSFRHARGMDEQEKKRAAEHVLSVMAEKGRDEAWLVTMTGLDPQTVKTFLQGQTWPRTTKRQAIEGALDLAIGTIERAARDLIPAAPPGDPVERAIEASRLSRGNRHKLIGIYIDMLEEQDRRRSG